jgi:hypothetical protein
MAKIEIDTKDIILALTCIVVVAISFLVGAFIFAPALNVGTPVATPTVSPTPTPTPTPTSYVTNDVKIITMSTSNWWPKVIVEDGRTFAVSWEEYDDILSLGDVVQFTVTGTTKGNSGETVYLTSSTTVVHSKNYWNRNGHQVIYGPSVVSSSSYYEDYYDEYYDEYPQYYYDADTHTAWQWDGYRADPISVKQLSGQRVIRGLPPGK